MAVTDEQYGRLRKILYRNGDGKEELKTKIDGLPSKAELRAAFDAIDNFWETNRTTLAADVRTALNWPSAPISLVTKIGRAWLRLKFEGGG